MSLVHRIWRVARRRVLLSLGLVQGAAFRNPTSRAAPPPPRSRRHPLEEDYRALGAPVGSDMETLRRCWRTQVRIYHPDRYGHSPVARQHAAERLRRANEAYRRLLRWHDRSQ